METPVLTDRNTGFGNIAPRKERARREFVDNLLHSVKDEKSSNQRHIGLARPHKMYEGREC